MPCRHMNCDSSRNVSRTTLNVEVGSRISLTLFLQLVKQSVGLFNSWPFKVLKHSSKKRREKKRKGS